MNLRRCLYSFLSLSLLLDHLSTSYFFQLVGNYYTMTTCQKMAQNIIVNIIMHTYTRYRISLYIVCSLTNDNWNMYNKMTESQYYLVHFALCRLAYHPTTRYFVSLVNYNPTSVKYIQYCNLGTSLVYQYIGICKYSILQL